MGNILAVDGIFKKERENSVRAQVDIYCENMLFEQPCYFLRGKRLLNLWWKPLAIRQVGHGASIAVFTGQRLGSAVVWGSVFLKFSNRVSGNYWKVWRKNRPLEMCPSIGWLLSGALTAFRRRTVNVFVVSAAAIWNRCGGSAAPFWVAVEVGWSAA